MTEIPIKPYAPVTNIFFITNLTVPDRLNSIITSTIIAEAVKKRKRKQVMIE
jgi:hypothetical protein